MMGMRWYYFIILHKINLIPMRKYVLFLLIAVSATLAGQDKEDVRIRIDAPANVVAGNAVEVEVTFYKGTLSDYSRFSQELPTGFTATNVSSPNADFTFDKAENRIRIIWLKLPDDDSVVVNYTITPDARLQGTLELGGSFAYVQDGARKFMNIEGKRSVNVLPNPELDPSQVVAIEDFPAMLAAVEAAPAEQGPYAWVVRQKPMIHPNGMVYVTLLVRKPEGTGFLKLEEAIPGGYTFESVEPHGAVVSQAASVAKFIWMKPPGDDLFTVQYRLIPILEKNQSPMVIEGNFTYTEEGESRIAEVKEVNADILAMTSVQKRALLDEGTVPEDLESTSSIAIKTEEKTKPATDQRQTASASERQEPQHQRSSGRGGVMNIPDLTMKQGIYFRVQVAAVRNPYFTTVYFSGYELLKDVMKEKEGGYHKYTVGPFTTYQQADVRRDRINKETPVEGAFVVAYRDGKRIAVSEALK
jgi:hypothetical protein